MTSFFRQMDYLTPELLRTLKPGRVAAIHVKDRVEFANVTGLAAPTIEPFHADCIAHFRRHGFAYFGMITVVTDVVRENNQTYRLGWTEQCKDGTKMGVGCPEYILLFRKLPTDRSRGYADDPVKNVQRGVYPRPLANRRPRLLAFERRPSVYPRGAGKRFRPRSCRRFTASLAVKASTPTMSISSWRRASTRTDASRVRSWSWPPALGI